MVRARWPWSRSARRSGAPHPDSDEITELLDTIRRLRTTLATDLSAVAGAIDANEREVARDIIAADQVEVRRLAAPKVMAAPAQRDMPRGRRRALIALPAIPLVGALAITGAAAFTSSPSSAHHRDAAPARSIVTSAQTPAPVQQTAATTLHQLERVVAQHQRQHRVVTVANHLHHQLTALIATAPHNPTRLGVVQRLLSVEQRLLESHHGEGTAIALAASRHLTELLAAAGLPTGLPSLPPILTKPTKPATTSPTSTSTPVKTKKPHPSATSSVTVSSSPSPSHSPTRTHQHHHQHRHLPNPLFGVGLSGIGL